MCRCLSRPALVPPFQLMEGDGKSTGTFHVTPPAEVPRKSGDAPMSGRRRFERLEEPSPLPSRRIASSRFIGIDIGAETIKIVEIVRHGGRLRCVRRRLIEHGKEPGSRLLDALRVWRWETVTGAAVSGRMSRQINLRRVPTKQAETRGYRFLRGNRPATIVSIGSHGFSVLELRATGMEIFRENSRCSQGTGNFLRQLVERFSLSIGEASELCADVETPAPLSGRCPVILKTDMTHLANKGENRAQILAGLFDAVCENVLVLVKPGISPPGVCLIGGVSRSRRIRKTFGAALAKSGMALMPLDGDDAQYFEALGAAVVASEGDGGVPSLDELLLPPADAQLERVTALKESLRLVRRMECPAPAQRNGKPLRVLLGFDIGSTGSKLVALDAESQRAFWEGYRRTAGDPVGAAQALLRQFVDENGGTHYIRALGVTGSGREIVGSLLSICYGKDAVFVLNEIAAHAEGALHFDPRVDTIFEIGGQDAKYIRLAEGRVVDCAMNEACSAGTGSFIEEQGGKFPGILDVAQLGREALGACQGVSLGQHCSVFMAEIIDEAVAAGVDSREIVAGLYDSIIQNYLHRVKGNRSVGRVIFCQGMPFSADALAAAVARQTGSEVVIPPNPGTVGAVGIALLTRRELLWAEGKALDPAQFLGARIEQKESFICKSNSGCGGAGNKCRIDGIRATASEQRRRFTWGGGCSLHDKGTRKRKLPDLAPDPFREREELVKEILARFGKPSLSSKEALDRDAKADSRHRCLENSGRRTVAISDEFMLKGLFPFFAMFLHKLGFGLFVPAGADHAALKSGIQEANVPFCAPMQLFHGLAGRMADAPCDLIFIPMVRGVSRSTAEPHSNVCPIVQGSPDVLRWDLRQRLAGRLVSPVINMGAGNLESAEFLESCQGAAEAFGVPTGRWRAAHKLAASVQVDFERRCRDIGRRALDFCAEHGLVPVVVLGRPYTIYNKVLNSNVPALLREQGAIGVPLDCYPIEENTPIFEEIYWGYSQRILRAAHQVRQTPGVYSLYCSNYACGPDSFSLHFYSYLMEGKPLAIIETDGHAGDAGTKTRIEAFLHCVDQDRRQRTEPPVANDLHHVQAGELRLRDFDPDERFLVPVMGESSEVVSACMRGRGFAVETLPDPDHECLRLGRRHTSGKECLPMCMTLGSFLKRIEPAKPGSERFALLLPRTCGPCRFGVYGLLNRITLERLGWNGRVRIWSPCESGYFDDLPAGFSILMFTGFMASDMLVNALLDVRPLETERGAANALYRRHRERLTKHLEREAGGDLSSATGLWQVASGNLFGVSQLLSDAAAEFAELRGKAEKPVVLLVGEIYVRSVPFANDFVIEKLEERGCRVRLAPLSELLEYADYVNLHRRQATWSRRFSVFIQALIRRRTRAIMSATLGWPPAAPVAGSLEAAAPYIRQDLEGEAVLTVGAALHEWRMGGIDAAVSVGPLECMPNKIAEAQFFQIAEREGLPSLTLSLNGDPMNLATLDNFAFEVQAQFQRRPGNSTAASGLAHPVPTCNGPAENWVHDPDLACQLFGGLV
jgi:predicted CoA-substrate-specific enzyme activase